MKLDQIKTHKALQPRNLLLLKARDQVRQEQSSQSHIHDMCLYLKASSNVDLIPLHLASVDGALYVVDGHHRLAAYKRAKRADLPAQVETMTLRQASHASKLANVKYTKLEMRPEQKRDALWQHMAFITNNGSLGLPKGVSQRSLQGQFGVALDTVQRMLARLPKVEPGEFPKEHCDAITGFPHWKFVRQTVVNDMYQQMTPDVRLDWQARKYTQRLVRLWDKTTPEAVELAHRRLREEAEREEAAERIEELDQAYLKTMEIKSDEF
ncbi:ParB N-terminal domain-containing protein [Agrilutibacter solisilvae]|uniref:ParB N-terminal domain-containing protein n=1 Tax=Agrilutibacter solisilvae TaxID=2763317 RepID=A0A974XYS4_9GAMM|nr:ParB N-terminal domain-containing protein [Lysobacter solisilvae]QSX78118.1 ParB N-terminal domain-containing protein [Lysobacter solisilvae]